MLHKNFSFLFLIFKPVFEQFNNRRRGNTHKPSKHLSNVWESYFPALEQGPLGRSGEIPRNPRPNTILGNRVILEMEIALVPGEERSRCSVVTWLLRHSVRVAMFWSFETRKRLRKREGPRWKKVALLPRSLFLMSYVKFTRLSALVSPFFGER